MGLFSKAKEAKKEAPAKSKGVTWLVDAAEATTIGNAIHELVRLDAEHAAISAKMEIHKNVVKRHAENKYVSSYALNEAAPDTPMIIQNGDGEKVTFVVQDRSGQHGIKEEQKEGLIVLLGQDATDRLLYDETTFGFNREIMAIPGVMEVVEKALEGALKKLIANETLNAVQADQFLDVKTKTTFKPGTLDRVTDIVGTDTNRIWQFIQLMGSACVRYVKT